MSTIDDSHKADYALAANPVTAFAATSATVGPICTLGLAGLSITVRKKSGTVNGQFKLQCTDFGADKLHLPADTDWTDYPNSNNPAAAGAITNPLNWEVQNPASCWFRVVFTDSASSSAVVDVAYTLRALP